MHVEGETEETFVNDILAPHLYNFGYTNVSARLLGNARMRSKRCGIKPWQSVRDEILNHLKEDTGSLATIIVDYYALPQKSDDNWPKRASANSLSFDQKPSIIENAIHNDVCNLMGSNFNSKRFIPYIVMHEFEGLLFSEPQKFADAIGKSDLANEFLNIKNDFPTPEHINDSPITAPSKRILNLIPSYKKPLMGTLAILEIGLDAIRIECPFFHSWITKLEHGCIP